MNIKPSCSKMPGKTAARFTDIHCLTGDVYIAEKGKIHDDLVEPGETCCPNRVARLARLAGIRAQIGYKHKPGTYGGKPSVVVDNSLNRQFDVATADRVWVSDITYIRTCEGFLYLAVVIDLHSRRVIVLSWFARANHCQVIDGPHNRASPQTLCCRLCSLSLIAVQSTAGQCMAVWRRKPKEPVLVHTDQGSQY
jgi:putative transposase